MIAQQAQCIQIPSKGSLINTARTPIAEAVWGIYLYIYIYIIVVPPPIPIGVHIIIGTLTKHMMYCMHDFDMFAHPLVIEHVISTCSLTGVFVRTQMLTYNILNICQ